jgi:hypothetical protein
MKTSARTQGQKKRADAGRQRTRGEELQPPATGAHRGSPAAPVMKQFAKTKSESSGRS